MESSLPVVVLTIFGALTAALGLFAAGDIAVVALGFGALFGAGILHAIEQRNTSG